MAKHMVICRVCKQQFDTNAGVEGVDWCKPNKTCYYHLNCYNSWKNKTKDVKSVADDDLWYDSLVEFLYSEVKMEVNFVKLKKQWESYIKKGQTAKGIYFAARYFYIIKHGDVGKSDGGIGIIPYIYEESCTYWANRERREQGICARIEQQLIERAKQKTITITQTKQKQKKTSFVDWSVIDDMPEEDGAC